MLELPELITLNLDNFCIGMSEIEFCFGKEINSLEMLTQLIDTIDNQKNAIDRLDNYCLDIANNDTDYEIQDYDQLLSYIHNTGMQLHRSFLDHRLYVDNVLMYSLVGIKTKSLYMQRKDVVLNELKKELRNAEILRMARSHYT